MSKIELVLYTRDGCCLCKGLEDKLSSIPLDELDPKLHFCIENIDGNNISEKQKEKYSMEVPVLAFRVKTKTLLIELPRVSPRLTEVALTNWLKKMISEKLFGHITF